MNSRFPLSESIPSRNNSVTEDEIVFPSPQTAERGMSVSSASGMSSLPPIPPPPSQSLALPAPAALVTSSTPAHPPISISPVSPTDVSPPAQHDLSSQYIPSPVTPSGSTFSPAHMNQVPVPEEIDPDTISVEPPPYTRYPTTPAGAASKQRPPRLNLVDPTALARALPTVPLAAATNAAAAPGDFTPVSAQPLGPYGMSAPPSRLTLDDRSTSNLALIPSGGASGSGRNAIARRSFRERILEVRSEKSSSISGKRVCGIKLRWIVMFTTVGSILLSIVLGVTLGLVLRDKRELKNTPAADNGNGNDDSTGGSDGPNFDKDGPPSPPFEFKLPLTMQEISVSMKDQTRTCLDDHSRLDGLSNNIQGVMWSCDIPDMVLHWEIEEYIKGNTLIDLKARPPILLGRLNNTTVFQYLISSQEMKDYIKMEQDNDFGISESEASPQSDNRGRKAVLEGIQPIMFYRQPLIEVPVPPTNQENGTIDQLFRFELVYTKEIILKELTLNRLLTDSEYLEGNRMSMGLDGAEIGIGETVWHCEWEKTYLSADLWMTPPGPSGSDGDSPDEDSEFNILNTVVTNNQPPKSGSGSSSSSDSDSDIKAMSAGVKTDKLTTEGLMDLPDYMADEQKSPILSKAQILRKRHRLGERGERKTELKVRIREDRPTTNELRKVFGIDQGDEDPEGISRRGDIKCSKKKGGPNGSLSKSDETFKFLPEVPEELVQETIRKRFAAGHMRGMRGMRRRQEPGQKKDCMCLWESSSSSSL